MFEKTDLDESGEIPAPFNVEKYKSIHIYAEEILITIKMENQ